MTALVSLMIAAVVGGGCGITASFGLDKILRAGGYPGAIGGIFASGVASVVLYGIICTLAFGFSFGFVADVLRERLKNPPLPA